MEFEITHKINQQDENRVFQGLLEYNLPKLNYQKPEELGVYLKNGIGQIAAGLIGSTHGKWLSVKYLWVSEELRRKNIGSQLLTKAEETAKQRGCRYSFLDTFSFQAPEFYKKYGYDKAFVLEECPVEGKRIYFTKKL